MYIATVPNRTSPPAILIRESYRHHGKVKSRTLANISDWDPARIEALRRALRGDFDHLAAADPTLGRFYGLLYALHKIAQELGITTALGKSRLGKLALLTLVKNEIATERAMELAGCYVVTSDVPKEQMSGQEVHDSYVSLQKVERDFRAEDWLAGSATGVCAQRE